MAKAVRNHLRSNVVGYVAIFLVLTMSTAYATHGAPDSISSEDIINGQVKTNDIANNQVRTEDVRDDTLADGGLAAEDLAPDAVGTSELQADAVPADGVGSEGSTKLAASSVGANEIKGDAVRTGEILDATIGTADLSASAFGARAYGYVTGTAVLSRSKNVDSVASGGLGIFCIDPSAAIDASTAVLIVSPDTASTTPGFANHKLVEWDVSGASCAAGTLAVHTYTYNGDEADDDGGFADSPGDVLNAVNANFAFAIP